MQELQQHLTMILSCIMTLVTDHETTSVVGNQVQAPSSYGVLKYMDQDHVQ